MRLGEILERLTQHPEVQRRRMLYKEAATQGKLKVDQRGWYLEGTNNKFITFGFWTSEDERLDLLNDCEILSKIPLQDFVSDVGGISYYNA